MSKFLAVTVGLAITGCAGMGINSDASKGASNVRHEIGANQQQINAPAAVYVSEPDIDPSPVEIIRRPEWFADNARILSSGQPFYFIAEDLLSRHGIYVKYGPEVDPNMPVQLVYRNGNVFGALEALSSSTGYSYALDGDQLTWSLYEVERFDLSYVGDQRGFLIGSKGGQTQQAGNSSQNTVEVGSNKDQFLNMSTESTSIYNEVETTLQGIIGDVGEVVASRSSSSVVVRTTASRMARVKEYMKSLNDALAKQIVMEVRVLKFTSTRKGATGIDWDLVRQSTNGTLSFNSSYAQGAVASLAGGTPVTLSGLLSDGSKFDGSTFLVSALEQQGQVAVQTVPRIVTQVNQVAELTRSRLTGYIARTEVTPNNDAEPSVAITPGTVKDGYTIFALANVDSSGRIYMHISSLLSDLLSISRKEVGASAIETPDFNESKFTQTVILKPGETMIMNGLKQVVDRNGKASPLNSSVLPTYIGGDQFIEETVVLITPTVLNFGA